MVAVQIWVLFIFLGFSLQSWVLNSQNLTCNSGDLLALEGFVSGLGSSAAIDALGWRVPNSSNSSTGNCCSWFGITCDHSSGRVVKLELQNRRLTGTISDSLAHLDQLRTLNLSHNILTSTLPNSLFHLPNLEALDLSSNEFSGSFPTGINLPSIQIMDLSDNSFVGSVPGGICVNSTRIRMLKLGMNYLSGSIPPQLVKCTSLEQFCVASNNLSGTIPSFLLQLQNLAQLTLQENHFDGSLSVATGVDNPSRLSHLDVSMNGLSGNVPDIFQAFPNLYYFSAHSNRFSGGIPLSLSNSHSISSLSLRNNSLNGLIHFNCSAMINLTSLDLGTNQLFGSIDNLASCPKLKAINLAKNNLSGPIPESFKNFSSLTYLSLSNCSFSNLSASLRVLQHCPSLTTLVLTMNFRGEELPSDETLQFNSLKALIIGNCQLTGTIPTWLSGIRDLQLLDLSWNRLTGQIPPFLGDFKSLFYLDLGNNSLSGEIPRNLTRLPSLIDRNISIEEPSPDFPFFRRRNTSDRGLQYNQIMSFPPTLDLSHNFLNGTIWPEFGKLIKLHVLDLQHNNLSGNIPSSLSGMRSIEILDLSHNDLSGTIPPSLVNLSFLSKFSVAYNNLNGPVPSGGQFQTFSNSSFEGNQGLCGLHTPSSCERVTTNDLPRKSKRRKGPIIGMAVGIGFGTVFMLALMLLIIIRASNRPVVDQEKQEDVDDTKELEEQLGSGLVVLFQNKAENNRELSLDDLLKSTDKFDQANIIGCGGFGLVYKATLPNGKKVAIKRLSGDCGQMEREFQAEVETLSRAQHPNLVLLQGYCKYKTDRLLIYSYMENGSLDYWLHENPEGPSTLDWNMRLQIAQGAAKGLVYLHQSCNPRILHRDIKSSNILLDEHFKAHLADFGLARLILPYDTHVTTDLVGTLGYIPPEYGQASVATYKGDIYSFGVVLLELLTGKRPMDMCKPKGSRDLITWVMQMKSEKREIEVFDPFIFEKEHAKEMLSVLEIACSCLKVSPKMRPSTHELVSWLDNIDQKT